MMSGDVRIRPFVQTDADPLVEVLTLNGQFGYPEIEGPAAMGRVAACEAAVFLVAENSAGVQGMIRAVYDGSRALIHLLSVHPDAQGRGIGGALVKAVQAELRKRGAPSMSVTVTDASAGFWQKHGFTLLPVHLMLKMGE